MQRLLAAVCSTALLVSAVHAADKPQAKAANNKPAAADRATPAKRAADEKKLRAAAADFATAYNKGDAKAIAAQFAPEAEMVDLDGNVVQGRDAIEKTFAEHLAEPLFKVVVEIESLRFVGDDIAVEDGHLIFTNEEQETTLRSRYTVVHQRAGGEWLIVSSRDVVNPHDRVPPHEHLKQLAWLIGDWVEERGDSIITTNCRWDETKNFLLSDFTVKVAGQSSISGTQRIGWDPLTKQIKTWTFDNDGGYGEGFWHRDGDRWLVKLSGVSADGRTGSTTQIHARVNDHSRTWSAIDRLLGGESLPDIREVTVVRAASKPKQPAAKKTPPPTKGKSN
ncbi:MAG TPA: SgcJ/EcaC family oxidoreductase [Pirellulales bacterium]|nr:SgcJ/EcaC family oxidoreductase [Pirellulales bacterium]